MVNTINYTINSQYKSGSYVIIRLFLNRPQLIYERRENHLRKKVEGLLSDIKNLLQDCNDIELIKKFTFILAELIHHSNSKANIRPYKLAEIKK